MSIRLQGQVYGRVKGSFENWVVLFNGIMEVVTLQVGLGCTFCWFNFLSMTCFGTSR